MRRLVTEYSELSDCRIALYDSNPAGAPAVVFVHGIGGSKAVWAPVLPILPEAWRIIAYDYRGGGESEETAPRKLALELWASDLRALLDARGVAGPVVLVGHSLGASIVLQFALTHPSSAVGLVLVGAQADICALGPLMQARADSILQGGVTGWVAGPWRAAPPFSKATMAARPEIIDEYAEMLHLTGAERYVRAVTAIAESPDLRGELGSISVPSLIVIGSDDDRTTPQAGWELVARLPDARGVELADVGHTVSFEAPERLAQELVIFVGRVAG